MRSAREHRPSARGSALRGWALRGAFAVALLPSAAVLLAGCFGPPPRGPVGPASTLTLENRTNDEICGVQLRRTADERGFGPNVMGKHETIVAGAKRLFPLTETRWNVRVKDCLGRTIYQRTDLPLGKEPVVVITDADADALLVGGQKYAH